MEEKADALNVRQITSQAAGGGQERPLVLLASSASGLSRAAGVEVPDAGEGTYLAAFWGEKPTGGYSIGVRSARATGNRVMLRLSLEGPPQDAMVIQVLTYPYAVAVIRGVDLDEKELVLVDQRGRKLGWPVRPAAAGG